MAAQNDEISCPSIKNFMTDFKMAMIAEDRPDCI
jgi:hypothetical protein